MEDVPGSARAPCECCGRLAFKTELTAWPVMERRRTFVGREGGSKDSLYRYEEALRDYRVCPACRARLESGEAFADIAGRRVRNQVILLIAVAAVIALGAVAFLPQLMSALWQTGGGR